MTEFLKEEYYIRLSHRPNKIYKITAVEAFFFTTGDESTAIFAAVTSGSESGWKELSYLEPDQDPLHLYQVVWGVKDGCQYYIKNPAGVNRLGIDESREIGYVDNDKSPWCDPSPLTQFWAMVDAYPSVNAKNLTAGSLTPKIWFRGMKYDLVEVSGMELALAKEKAKPLTMGGVRTS